MNEWEPSGNFHLDYRSMSYGLQRGDPEVIAYVNRKRAERGEPPWEGGVKKPDDAGIALFAGGATVAVMGLIFAFIRFVM